MNVAFDGDKSRLLTSLICMLATERRSIMFICLNLIINIFFFYRTTSTAFAEVLTGQAPRGVAFGSSTGSRFRLRLWSQCRRGRYR